VISKRHILDEIRRTAEANGGVPLGWRKFATETGIRDPDWKGKLWARWSDAVREAGLTPNKLTEAYAENELLDMYAKLALEIGRLPTVADIRLSVRNGLKFPEYSTFANRFGGKAQLIEKLLIYCKARPAYADVVALCEGYVPRNRRSDKTGETSGENIGAIYLAKSGRSYKIGRSKAVGRREYELAIQLPEKIKVVHQIRTDDPVGIEAYWHKRFEAKRTNGE
jgi:hypothetical protein